MSWVHRKTFVDLSGQRFGRLTVAWPSGKDKHEGVMWLCYCDCGNMRLASTSRLNTAKSTQRQLCCSRGCAHLRHGHARREGAQSGTYRSWQCMLQRCENQNSPKYSDYGGRGITVCERWHKFAHFLADMSDCPQGLSIERINNDGNYEPGNCKWATRREQQQNRRNTSALTLFYGAKIDEAAQRLQMTRMAIVARLKLGWPSERAFTEPFMKSSTKRR